MNVKSFGMCGTGYRKNGNQVGWMSLVLQQWQKVTGDVWRSTAIRGRLPVKKGFKKQGQTRAGGVQGTTRVVRRSTAKKHGRCTFDRRFTVFKVFCILFKLFTLPLS